MNDRMVHHLWNQALSPIAECTGDQHSQGFRPYRSAHDAMHMVHIRLSNRYRPEWVLEGDIEKFFDKISHDWLLGNIPINKKVLKKMLKAGHIEQKTKPVTVDEGVPQGSPLSPTISNIVLDGLQDAIYQAQLPIYSRLKRLNGKYPTKVTMIRYADDFIVTAARKEMLTETIKPAINEFLQKRGVRLSEAKTLITHVEKGFDFLGQNVRLYKDKSHKRKESGGKVLLIKPSRKSINKLKNRISDITKTYKGNSQGLIYKLNPILRGWSNYHRTVVSKKAFVDIGQHLWKVTQKWVRAKHRRRSKSWLKEKYQKEIGDRKWVFQGENKESKILLFNIANVPIRRHVMVKNLNPYEAINQEYFIKRQLKRSKDLNLWDNKTLNLLKREKYLCPVCDEIIQQGDEIEKHHKLAKKHGGLDNMKNLVVLHKDCHKTVTNCKPKYQNQARFVEKGIIIDT